MARPTVPNGISHVSDSPATAILINSRRIGRSRQDERRRGGAGSLLLETLMNCTVDMGLSLLMCQRCLWKELAPFRVSLGTGEGGQGGPTCNAFIKA